ncbi:hypothetical protein B0I08_103107 [Glaciihabitans tibetensis]|uniref:Dolichyl-phosphate-mannose-protein mannosyltransferase n=1 Tax=Glaciihabitans tibetensis TaxID=1266600 RepID=A0A2T0VFG3_9MICO|nr:hypothetical protein [Glaciihabitans tibetensis]PRY68902.1 hypothetical protein B0I08_103107 [Glaciihabitans tibetensis]
MSSVHADGSSHARGDRISAAARSAVTLLFAGIVGYAVSTSVQTRAENPLDISNVYNGAYGWNPENNFLQVITFLVVTALVYPALVFLGRWRPWALRVAAVCITSVVVVASRLIAPAAANSFDFFHFGEQLAPARAVFEGAEPFVDAFVLHGGGEDLLKPIVGFVLFGGGEPNAGAYLLISVLLRSLAVFGFLAAVATIVRSQTGALLVLAWFSMTTLADITYTKSLFYSAFVVLLWLAVEKTVSVGRRLILLAGSGVVASLALAYSIDVGAMLGLLAAGISIALVFASVSDSGNIAFRLPRRWTVLLPGLAITAGVLIVQLILFLALRPNAYLSFLQSTFLEIPRYQGLTWDFPLSGITNDRFNVWVPILVLAVLTVLLGDLVTRSWRSDRAIDVRLGLAVVLWAAAIINVRFSVGRPDDGHLYLAGPPIFLAAAYTLQLVIERVRTEDWGRAWTAAIIGLLAVVPAGAVDVARLAIDTTALQASARTVKNFPLQPDDAWLDESHRAVVEYVQANSEVDDPIWVMEPEPSLYYFSQRENPTRFYVSWFVDPRPWTEEALTDLKANPPELVVYSTGSSYANSDGIPIWDRIPEIDEWVLANYPERVQVGDAVILTK